jgi:hypothetical protein
VTVNAAMTARIASLRIDCSFNELCVSLHRCEHARRSAKPHLTHPEPIAFNSLVTESTEVFEPRRARHAVEGRVKARHA